ncbi:hypothetical protein G4177_33955 [Corallococcus sp. ZKHCc1 1396]|uniref:Uncharacterized protein n=1 Tax=Corallococcus soli TaxID=2710757 RepID=A0ABR9PZ10_9BACT|nr:hypothetical protein [Corallococcus soli]MBE4753166.1 hypothetical protein [Corallococcus soli]
MKLPLMAALATLAFSGQAFAQSHTDHETPPLEEPSTDAPQDSAERWDRATGGSGGSGVLQPDDDGTDSVADPDRIDEGVGGSGTPDQGTNSTGEGAPALEPSVPNTGTPGNKGAHMEVTPPAWDKNKQMGSSASPTTGTPPEQGSAGN